MNSAGAGRLDAADSDNFWTSCVESRIPTPFPSIARALKRTASLDSEIEKIEACLVLARKRRNMSAACSRLPRECLLKIFTILRETWPPCRKESAVGGYTSGWMTVTHVCSAWREFALSTPSLWADLHCTRLNPSFMTELLRRSKLAPLSLRFSVSSKDNASALAPWLQGAHTRRMDSLSIINLSQTSFDLSMQLVSHLAQYDWSSLKSCQLASSVSMPNHALPRPLFSEGRQPHLTSLRLNSFAITWPFHFSFQHIQDLRLFLFGLDSTADSSAGILLTTQQLIEMLSAMNAPRIIELTNIFPLQDSEVPDEVVLPKTLQRLVLRTHRRDQAIPCAQLWSRLNIPHTANVSIDIRSAGADHLQPLRHIFAQTDSGFQTHPVEIVIGKSSILLLGSETFENPCPMGPNRMLDKTLRKIDPNEFNAGPNAFLHLPPQLSSSTFQLNFESARVLHFSLVTPETGTEQHWLKALTGARNVERVVLRLTEPSTSLLYAMARTVNLNGSNVNTPALFPVLRILTLHCKDDYMKDAQLPIVVNVIIYLIHVRRECGSPIQALQVSTSNRDAPVWLSVANEVPITWF